MSPRALSVVAFLLVMALLAFIPFFLFPQRWVGQVYVGFAALGVVYLLVRRRRPPPPQG